LHALREQSSKLIRFMNGITQPHIGVTRQQRQSGGCQEEGTLSLNGAASAAVLWTVKIVARRDRQS
jgi:hypothetical protein